MELYIKGLKAPPSPYVSVKSVGKHSAPRFSGQHQSAASCPYKVSTDCPGKLG